jgi:uncharacterized protein (DUF934 family)
VTETVAAPRLWTPQGFREDDWRHAGTLGEAGANDRVILPLEAFLALDADARAAASSRLGVLLLPAEPVDALAPFVDGLALVALAFPAFNDGRSYSKAELLRRSGFAGTLRATGDVLIDQIPLMLRTGFDEFEVSHPTALRRLDEGRVGGIAQHYQPTALPAAAGETYSWRRRA